MLNLGAGRVTRRADTEYMMNARELKMTDADT
jgi:hypothetical protein